MTQPTTPAMAPPGLYYVDRDDQHAYLLSNGPLPPIEDVELAIMREIIGSFGGDKARYSYNALEHPHLLNDRTPQAPFTPDAAHGNGIGAPFGLYYVTSDNLMYNLIADGYPPLTRLDVALLRGYVQHAVDEIRAARVARR